MKQFLKCAEKNWEQKKKKFHYFVTIFLLLRFGCVEISFALFLFCLYRVSNWWIFERITRSLPTDLSFMKQIGKTPRQQVNCLRSKKSSTKCCKFVNNKRWTLFISRMNENIFCFPFSLEYLAISFTRSYIMFINRMCAYVEIALRVSQPLRTKWNQ